MFLEEDLNLVAPGDSGLAAALGGLESRGRGGKSNPFDHIQAMDQARRIGPMKDVATAGRIDGINTKGGLMLRRQVERVRKIPAAAGTAGDNHDFALVRP